MMEINITAMIDMIIKYGPTFAPYLGIYLLTQAIKNGLKLKGDQVLPVIFLVSCIVAFAQMVVEKTALPWLEFACWVLIRGLSLLAWSWFVWWAIKRYSGRKKAGSK
jgi:hypothetical protein